MQAVCTLGSLSTLGFVQNLIICVIKMACRNISQEIHEIRCRNEQCAFVFFRRLGKKIKSIELLGENSLIPNKCILFEITRMQSVNEELLLCSC